MKRLALITLALCTFSAWGQTINTGASAGSNASSNANSSSQSGTAQVGVSAEMGMGNITFEGSSQRKHQSISTTPNVYIAPSMFGGSNNCGQSNTMGVGVTGFGIGGSVASESSSCNAREDTATAYKLGYKEVAEMRFFCFGEEENRLAWEATGHTCPPSAGPVAQNRQTVAATPSSASFGPVAGYIEP
ncbi:hypothetical protein CAL18_03225 [Bordetella genomosp. 7]|jgi:hypothetical protein|uniref:Secreted protein n=1 Tax=Bordetella genomosp. 7 TaxID=1416805 RepID=A0A261RI24_9BORD|nr:MULTISPECIES: hypothetical protein [Bordetella]OZI24605.1 hypothetical protein CAL19_03600 [Bordetella genomosp. 7]OZI28384.1 hypothetical protein CAL18_03225 [Bordetella genomosp. 7]